MLCVLFIAEVDIWKCLFIWLMLAGYLTASGYFGSHNSSLRHTFTFLSFFSLTLILTVGYFSMKTVLLILGLLQVMFVCLFVCVFVCLFVCFVCFFDFLCFFCVFLFVCMLSVCLFISFCLLVCSLVCWLVCLLFTCLLT